MKTLAVISQKGGAGKSLISAHLAVAFEEAGISTVIIDLDDQGSVTKWGESRVRETPVVVSAMPDRLAPMLARSKRAGVGLVVIDTPPYSSDTSLSAAGVADLVLVPTRPAIFDLRSIEDTAKILQVDGKIRKAVAVLNAVRHRGNIGDEAEVYAKQQGLEVAPARISDRVSFADALIAGQGITEYEPKGKAAGEMRALCTFLAKRLKLIRGG
jgi:chromosome partitioning protein